MGMEAREIKLTDVIFREDLYPRIETNASTVQQYAESIEVLPPIEINQRNELIDGWHRWTAHKTANADMIKVFVTPTQSDAELLELAIERNSKHGLQLSQSDKTDMARRIYNATPERERDGKKAKLATLLSVPERTIRDWLSRIDKDTKAARNKRIFDLWMACYTQQEIAEHEGLSREAISDITSSFGSFGNLAETTKATALHQVDFEVPIYNVWKQQSKSGNLNHFGNSEVKFVDNLLYLYTKPFDIVVDPFAGSGSTIDICKKRLRRYWVSDRKPIVAREKDIRKHDVTDGLPAIPRWKDVKLVYLDPPYWKQSENQYSSDPEDLANMSLDVFNSVLSELIKGFSSKLSDAYIALIIQPTHWKAENHQFTDHIKDMLCAVKLPVDMRYSVPYESQQCTAQMVDWAKSKKKCLVLTREIVVWRIN
jgi:hypothetical protein